MSRGIKARVYSNKVNTAMKVSFIPSLQLKPNVNSHDAIRKIFIVAVFKSRRVNHLQQIVLNAPRDCGGGKTSGDEDR